MNGIRIARCKKDNVRLIDFLREELKLTGTKEGCSVGGASLHRDYGRQIGLLLLLAAQSAGRGHLVEALHHDPSVKNAERLYSSRRRSVASTPGVLMSAKRCWMPTGPAMS